MLLIESSNKQYYCPLKNNRQVNNSIGFYSYRRVDSLEWNSQELDQGKTIKIKCCSKQHKGKQFRGELSVLQGLCRHQRLRLYSKIH